MTGQHEAREVRPTQYGCGHNGIVGSDLWMVALYVRLASTSSRVVAGPW